MIASMQVCQGDKTLLNIVDSDASSSRAGNMFSAKQLARGNAQVWYDPIVATGQFVAPL
jgi:hypothetical protein